MSSERDELRSALANTICNVSNYPKRAMPYLLGGDMSPVLDRTADALLATGYRKPRQVTTVEELDAAVYAAFEEGHHLVLSDCHARPWIIWSDEDGDEQVNSWPQEEDHDRLALGDITLPATVIHVGARA